MSQRHERPALPSWADYLIWWTDRFAVDAVITGGTPLPAYVHALFQDRGGRNAGGRLWSDPDMPKSRLPWNDNDPTCQAASRCEGVVFRRADLDVMANAPGFITDATMTRIDAS